MPSARTENRDAQSGQTAASASACAGRDKRPPLRLIVHADDFGLSEAVNRGILKAHTDGILTSTSLMAGAGAFEHAVEICSAAPGLDVGVHLTLVEERPTLGPDQTPSLVDGDGRFHRHATVFAGKYLQGKIALDEVRKELDSQIRKALGAGLPISHLDSHQHLHMLPGILRVTLDLAREYGIPHVRFPRETIRPYMFGRPAGLGRVAQLAALNLFCRLGRHRFLARSDHFAGFYFGGALNRSNLQKLVSNLPSWGVCELMCHPGEADPGTVHGHWGYSWEEELQALTDAAIAPALKQRRVELISYRDLEQAPETDREAGPT